ncbi:nuclear pore complex component-domain-containing protein [Talaromyces proteolyticus]|uniref:Nuclear pore complex component-domain-containing protein n=1 Tax=Talaromyces proteolyticus TaxID=1131652 RepID=A0AAD4KVZ2_9EURO|nr:nuclear pore complex component-domain-containing protein [Talaromyces proteolyticus]KAH8702237.1 nuclear pore complex component-domain-containing protein [Talaromyces proteolyticus]
MASITAPSTPKASPNVDSQTPGKWRHPRLKEIIRRQNAATFDSRNVKTIALNVSAVIGTLVVESPLRSFVANSISVHGLDAISGTAAYTGLVFVALRLLFLFNILAALYPLFRPKDDLSDIPLTPTQRALLGLDPNSAPPSTPGTHYITPPRYRLASGSRAGSPTSRATSPTTATGSPAPRRSSYSPTTSPLFQKAMANGNRESSRRQSFGSSSFNSSLRESTSSLRESTLSSLPSSPSPLVNKGNKLGLSNKWLYEKSRRHSGGNNLI